MKKIKDSTMTLRNGLFSSTNIEKTLIIDLLPLPSSQAVEMEHSTLGRQRMFAFHDPVSPAVA